MENPLVDQSVSQTELSQKEISLKQFKVLKKFMLTLRKSKEQELSAY